MAKYLQQAPRKKHRGLGFLIFVLVYAAVILTAGYFGLKELNHFLKAYEISRPANTIGAYMASLTPEHISDLSQELIDQIDHNIQSEEACRQVIQEAVGSGVNFAKKAAECTEDKLVYVLRTGKQVIGQVELHAQQADKYGMRPWKVGRESFDLSYLLGEKVSLTAPEDYPVSVNGVVLDKSYRIGDEIRYELLEDYYDTYDLPVRVTYEAGPFLGNFDMTATDLKGVPVEITEDMDVTAFLHNCTEEENEKLQKFIDTFIQRYVDFTGIKNKDLNGNHMRLIQYIVPDTELFERTGKALEGLFYTKSVQTSVLDGIDIHHLIRLEDGTYLADLTYYVNVTTRTGTTRTVTNVQIVIVETESGLKAQSMTNYS